MDCPNLFTRPVYGVTADGGFEEYCRVNAQNLVKVPKEVSFDFAASLADAGMTSYHAVNSTGEITKEDNVLIYGVGGVATYAIQLAKLKGAKVIVVSRTPAKLEMARKMGVDHVINSREQNVASEVKTATDGRMADVVIDFIPKDSDVKQKPYLDAVAGGARIVQVAFGSAFNAGPMAMIFHQLSFIGSSTGTKEELAETLDLAKDRKLKSPVTRKAGLEEINQGLEDLRQGKVLGRACVAF